MKTFLKLSAVMAVMLVPVLAQATHFETCGGSADCDGWTFETQIAWRANVYEADLTTTVVMTDASGAEVINSVVEGVITRDAGTGAFVDHVLTGAWNQELCGTYEVTVTFDMVGVTPDADRFDISSCSFTAVVICDCDEPQEPACTKTPGYWKNHEEAWPVDELELGGIVYSKDELLEILNTPVRRDATIILAKHLIAAKLNLLMGTSDRIVRVVDRADALLAEDEVGTKPRNRRVRMRLLLAKCLLAHYNEMGCRCSGFDEKMTVEVKDFSSESETWGQLKASYR